MYEEKSDLEQLRGILGQFSEETITRAVRDYVEDDICQKSYKDFEDPGPEVEVGEESRIDFGDMSDLERLIAEKNFLPVHFLEEGAVVQKAVARVVRTSSGSGWGTGFMVSPTLFMTNNHVIPSQAFARSVSMQFNYQLDYSGTPQSVDAYTPDPDSVFYTNAPLDFTLVKLNPRCKFVISSTRTATPATLVREADFAEDDDEEEAGLLFEAPYRATARRSVAVSRSRIGRYRRLCIPAGQKWGYLQLTDAISYAGPGGANHPLGQHVNVIQHPRGRRKEVALQRNNLKNIYATRIRYTSDTEPGSSGSPVFNNHWDLIAIHHAAGEWDPNAGAWVSNEGMRMDKIIADLRSHYAGTTTGDQILSELGI